MVVIPLKLIKEFGGVNRIGICYKVTNVIHMFDPISMRKYTINKDQYFNNQHEFIIVPFKAN